MSTIIHGMTEKFTDIRCGSCGIVFFVPEEWQQKRWEERTAFYCPNGCIRKPLGETEKERADRLAKELEATKRRLDTERAEHQKELKRVHERTTAGVCQWCDRTFTNVARHIKMKHPEEVL